MTQVIVLGAGVVGLQSALSLLEAGYKVTIIAKHFPGDLSSEYTSPWAGGHWRTHASAEDHEQQSWDLATYHHWTSLIASHLLPSLGLKRYESYSYHDLPLSSHPWYAEPLGFKVLPPSSHPVPGLATANVFRAIALNPPAYLAYLLARIHSLGGTTQRRTLPQLAEATPSLPPGIVVNCLALGNAASDPAMLPIKGQTVTVRGEADAIRTHMRRDGIAYVIPRPGSGTTILGGTKDEGNADPAVDEAVSRRIVANCKALVPELLNSQGEFEVVSAQAGFRPGRKGGPRMEREWVGGRRVVHAYGHAGSGFQNSVGVGRKVVKLVGEWEGPGSKL